MKKILGLFLIGMVMVACNDSGVNASGEQGHPSIKLENGKFTDKRDGNKYAVVEIGDKIWMAENLRYTDSSKTKNLKGNVWCYENKADNCSKYGPLYSWTAAMDFESEYNSTRKNMVTYHVYDGICPDGWHIPSTLEWQDLKNALQNQSVSDIAVGASMKSIDGWVQGDSASKAMNRFGFNALPAGRRNSENGEFMSTGKYAFFWASDEVDEGTSIGWGLRYDWDRLEVGNYYKDHGMSVRCVIAAGVKRDGDIDSSYLDKIPFDYGELEFEGTKYKTIKIGDQNWMAENMNFKTDDSWCYNDDSEKCEKYGRLYSFEQAKAICPEGWHLPTSTDVRLLSNNVKNYASSLRSREGWTDKGGKGWNLWGFNMLPAGGRESGDYFDSAVSAYMWVDGQQVMWLRYYNEAIQVMSKGTGTAFPVRCVED